MGLLKIKKYMIIFCLFYVNMKDITKYHEMTKLPKIVCIKVLNAKRIFEDTYPLEV